MYAQVIVLTYQSPGIDSYTYEVPKELDRKIKIGQLVSVPFGKRNPQGLVLSLISHPGESETSDRIWQSKDSIAEFILNKNKILRSAQNDGSEGLQNDIGKKVQIDKKIQIKSINSIVLNQPILLPYQIELLKWMSSYYLAPMIDCLKAMMPTTALNAKRPMTNAENFQSVSRPSLVVSQTLVLVPTLNRIPETLASFPQARNYVIYHGELKDQEKFNAWQKIASGNVDYIFGSRTAIFTPAPNLKKIIIFDEHDNAYKDNRSPYFDTLTVAEKLNELTGAQLEIVDSSPKITTYINHQKEIDFGGKNRHITNIKIVSMTEERAAGFYSPISRTLSSYLLSAAENDKRTLLFLNKKVESGYIYCRNCKTSQFSQKQPDTCPNCQSQDTTFHSTNIKTLASEAREILPSAQINLIAENLNHQIYPTTKLPNHPTIDIATSSVFYRLTPQKYEIVAHIFADSALNIADIDSAQNLYAQITNLKKLCKRFGLLILQTYNPNHPAIQNAAADNFQKFYKDELQERQLLLYPPFALLVKIVVIGKNETKTEEKAQKLKEELEGSRLSINHLPLTILGPYKPFFQSKTAKYNIILKIPMRSYSLKARQEALFDLSRLRQIGAKIIVEPGSIN